MNTMSEEELHNLVKLCDCWMHQPKIPSLCFKLLASRKEEKELHHLNSHECLLLITCALERSLGNVDNILY